MNFRFVGMLLLGIYLLLVGLLALTNIQFEAERVVLGLLALVAGGCLIAAEIAHGGRP
jgi:uncharacterized membrane protein HdeD (DUF308 family)